VFVELEPMDDQTGLSLVLVGNPLQNRAAELVHRFPSSWSVRGDVPLSLAFPAPGGIEGASLLSIPAKCFEAARTSRSRVKDCWRATEAPADLRFSAAH